MANANSLQPKKAERRPPYSSTKSWPRAIKCRERSYCFGFETAPGTRSGSISVYRPTRQRPVIAKPLTAPEKPSKYKSECSPQEGLTRAGRDGKIGHKKAEAFR